MEKWRTWKPERSLSIRIASRGDAWLVRLEQQRDHVFCYVRNDRPFLLIPYEYEAAQHHYEPDYIVKLRNGLMVLLE